MKPPKKLRSDNCEDCGKPRVWRKNEREVSFEMFGRNSSYVCGECYPKRKAAATRRTEGL